MVNKFQNLIRAFDTDKKSVLLMAVLKMDEYLDKWSLIISAPWITEENKDESFSYIKSKILTEVDPDVIPSIARVGLLAGNKHLVEELVKYDTDTILLDTRINGNTIHEGHILQVNRQFLSTEEVEVAAR